MKNTQKDKQTGLVQIYTGEGKGKSTAAFGMALRAAGWGMKTAIIQFMKKGEWYGESKTLTMIPQIEVYAFGAQCLLRKGQENEEHTCLALKALAKAEELLFAEIDILILDEIFNAIWFDLISEEDYLALLAKKPTHLEIIATGRNASETAIAKADLVTEMQEIKHPYQKGILARKGIEF